MMIVGTLLKWMLCNGECIMMNEYFFGGVGGGGVVVTADIYDSDVHLTVCAL